MIKFWSILMLSMTGVLLAESAQVKHSFEKNDFSGWNMQGEGWSIYAKAASDGEKSAMCVIPKGTAPQLKACALQIKQAAPGWVLTARIDVSGKVKSKSSNLSFVVMCLDKDGNTLREERKKIIAPSKEFQKIALPEIVVPSGTVEAYLMVVVEVTQTTKGKDWWRFDNVVIDVK